MPSISSEVRSYPPPDEISSGELCFLRPTGARRGRLSGEHLAHP